MSKIAANFIKDRLLYILGYIIGISLFILYGYLITGIKDWIYPFSLSFFVYLIIICIDFFRYYRFNKNIEGSIKGDYYDLEPITNEQQNISNLVQRILEQHSKELHKRSVEEWDKQHFLSQWIHNMKTPIAVTALILQRYKMEMGDKEEFIRDIEEENDRLHNGLEQILNINRMEEFFRDYEPEVVDLVALLKEVINSKRSQFIYSNVYPKLDFDFTSSSVITDSKWNRFMLEQLINNAIKYSESKDESKYVIFSITKNNEKTTLSIKDQGVGIPEQDLLRIFEPFFTGENGRRFKNSTGIGLYITSKIAEKLDLHIDIESKVGQGTKVNITYITKL